MNFEEYLIAKKIDSSAFRAAEASVWNSWKSEFEHLHPNSFTVQKLNLINPVRRKYPLKEQKAPVIPPSPVVAVTQAEGSLAPVVTVQPATAQTNVSTAVSESPSPAASPTQTPKPPGAKPAIPRPVIKPKPKIN